MDAIEKEKKIQQYKERFVRWQQLTLVQFSYTNNLLLTFSVGYLAFFFSKAGLKYSYNCSFVFFTVLSYALLLTSLLTGVLLTLNRLNDFRKTKDIIKNKRKRFEAPEAEKAEITSTITILKEETDKIGGKTWCLLQWQLWTFFAGCTVSLVTLVMLDN